MLAKMLRSMVPMSRLTNYATPGLVSTLYMKGNEGEGCLREFWQYTRQMQEIAPHSHRYDFMCLVLEGEVRNTLWIEEEHHEDGVAMRKHYDLFNVVTQRYDGNFQRTATESRLGWFEPKSFTYIEGDVYAMTHDQIHSINFEKGTRVLFLEGPTKSGLSQVLRILDPTDDAIPIDHQPGWMFKEVTPRFKLREEQL